MATEQDKEAAKALTALAYRLLVNEIDFGQIVEAFHSTLNQPEKEKAFYQ